MGHGREASMNSWLKCNNPMTAHYDSYDYSSYWTSRDYEHESEVIAIREFLNKIPKINKALEIGGGFGRLVPYYIFRTKSTTLTEPSLKLLSLAKTRLSNFKNLNYIQSTIENLTKKFRANSFDLIVMVRVMHHMKNPSSVFDAIEKLLSPTGYVIFEFANKIHFKNIVNHTLKGDLKYVKNMETIDVRSKESKENNTISFLNYHPEIIKSELEKHNFEIVEMRSVSNIRSPFLKKHLPKGVLIEIEKNLQKLLSYIYFGPSIFVLARKKG
jgi:ubiquinone/menaquinone biosynthesis C-methylase UbiE